MKPPAKADDPSGYRAYLPISVLLLSTVAAILVSLMMLLNGVTIVFQNLFYIPIIIACYFFLRRGLLFSIGLIAVYAALILQYTSDPVTIFQAAVRILIFLVVALITTYLAERVEDERARYASIFHSSGSGIGIYDIESKKFTEANEQFFGICGRPPASLPGMQPGDIVGESLAAGLLKDGPSSISRQEMVIARPDGSTRTCIFSATPIGHGLLALTVDDISDRKIAEDRRYALLAYIDESVMRVQKPLELSAANLTQLGDAMARSDLDFEDARAQIMVQARVIDQISENLKELVQAVADERDEVTGPFREFLCKR